MPGAVPSTSLRPGTFDGIAATPADVDDAARAAAEAFVPFMETSPEERASLLEAIAGGIERLGDALLTTVIAETRLAPARVAAERDRTTAQLRGFARLLREGAWVEAMIDRGDPERRPAPKPDVRRMLRPIGPVAVFGASNFPLAFSVAGGDTASALAAGCPVVVKEHPAHPRTGALVAEVVRQAVAAAGLPPGVFAYLPATGLRALAVGEELVRHPAIKAGGFTGSSRAGRALAALAAARPEPIPFFCEMGSVNPVIALPGALRHGAAAWAERLFASFTNSSGQFCTRPSVVFAQDDEGAARFIDALVERVRQAVPQPMLTVGILGAFEAAIGEIAALPEVRVVRGAGAIDHAAVTLAVTSATRWREEPHLRHEIFGPSTVVALCRDGHELESAAQAIDGALAAVLWAADTDHVVARRIARILERRAGRVVFNGVPTGVEVCPAMVHTGPFPASNRPDATSVGSLAIRRWCRPVCWQDFPEELLPPELRDEGSRE